MNLIEEYRNQNTWRDWERYIDKLPLNNNQVVYDLGCSIGAVSNLLSKKVKKVVGFDNDNFLLEEANKEKEINCQFISENIFTLNPNSMEKCHGLWMSFTIAYMEDPRLFITNWMKCLNIGGWFAIADIDGLFSSHLPSNSKYSNKIQAFEKGSQESKIYDFRVGRKIKNLMEESGLEIIVDEDDWYDVELNFKGRAKEDIYANWEARLERMVNLKSFFGEEYADFCNEFLNNISNKNHMSQSCVQFYVGIKRR